MDRFGVGKDLHRCLRVALQQGDQADSADESLVLVVAVGDHEGLGLHLSSLANHTKDVGSRAGGRDGQVLDAHEVTSRGTLVAEQVRQLPPCSS